jgi:EmrB/QacA subfamily drug resistance transporter
VTTALPVVYGTTRGRWIVVATVLGSGVVFLDGNVVNVALPHIGEDFGAGLAGLQWVVDAYAVTLTALVLLGGSLGDLFGRRRIFLIGLVGFSGASLLCGMAPSLAMLVAARALQGVAGALLVPGSLALLTASFEAGDRARAVGAWSGLAAVATALGPFAGGWLVDAASWRLVFLVNLPVAALAGWAAWRHVPESRPTGAPPLDLPGAALVTGGLAMITYGLIERGTALAAVAVVAGAMAMIAFLVVEATSRHPLLPLGLFRSAQFSGANLTTFAIYAGLGVATFLLVLQLQVGLGYSALEAGASLLPVTVLMLALSARMGALAQRIGPRPLMTVGPLVMALGLLVFATVAPGSRYFTTVLPGAVIFGMGLAMLVAPLTATVMGSVAMEHAGVASGVNNAVARFGGLVAVAVLPGLAGVGELVVGQSLGDGFATAMRMAAGLCVIGALVAFATVRKSLPTTAVVVPMDHPCQDPCVSEQAA